MDWEFKKLQRGDQERNPHESEFFRVKDPSEVIVREFIQNSLDARKTNKSIKVTFLFGDIEKEKFKNFTCDLDRHLKACKLFPESLKNRNINYLVIEDFGTTGLDGLTFEDGFRPEKKSNFYNFWWCEGKSLKKGIEAGRWGLGKTAFNISSKMRTFYGLTIRNDDNRELLMGKALLKSHKIKEDHYQYYGYFSEENYNPIDDENIICNFKNNLNIKRKNETGLSIVIPLPDEEINKKSIIQSVIINYFFAIMKDILVVEIYDRNNISFIINKENIIKLSSELNWDGTSWKKVNVPELLQFINESINCKEFIEIVNSDIKNNKIPDISKETIINFDEVKNSFNSGNFLAFKIPIYIKENNKEQGCETYFKLYCKKFPSLKNSEEFYIRSGITILDNFMLGARTVRSILVAEDKCIATFLGDAETPAHTKWNERTEGFIEKYEDARRNLRFVKGSISKIIRLLDEPPKERQKDFFKDIFFIPKNSLKEADSSTKKTVIVPINKKPSVFRIDKIEGGFKISLKENRVSFPLIATIMVAYDVRRGNPFKQYDVFDFNFKDYLSIKINREYVNILHRDLNMLKLKILNKQFFLKAEGFDDKRDLIVNVKEG